MLTQRINNQTGDKEAQNLNDEQTALITPWNQDHIAGKTSDDAY